MSYDKPIKKSKFVDSSQFDAKDHAIAVDKDLQNIFLYTASLPTTGTGTVISGIISTAKITVGGTTGTMLFANGMLIKQTQAT